MADVDGADAKKGGFKIKTRRKSERFSAMAKRGNDARGIGKGSRSATCVPPVGYEVQEYEKSTVMTTPGKHRYRSSTEVAEVLQERGFDKSFVCDSSEEDMPSTSAEDMDYTPNDPAPSKPSHVELSSLTETSCETWSTLASSVFIEYGEAVGFLIDQVNQKRRCATEGCQGILVPCEVGRAGLGGSMKAAFRCTGGCQDGVVHFGASAFVREERRQIAGHVVALSFILNGNTYEKYAQTLGLGLGIPVFTFKTYNEILKKAYPHIHHILNEQMKKARSEMKEMDPTKFGSWERAVTSGDGVYHTRGHHSKNMTVLLVNYLENSLIAAVHLCMRGNDITTEHIPLFNGTAKAAEGYGFELVWEELKNEGLKVEVHWQDADTSAKSFRKFYPKATLMYCGGHVGRAHGKQLEKLAAMKSFSDSYQKKHPAYKLNQLKCQCKKHTPTCGCLTPKCIKQMKINHFAALVQSGTDHETYNRRMKALGNYHAQNIHSWEGGACDFHGDKSCSCGKCKQQDIKCEGKPYTVKHPLTCPMHSMAYRVECDERASKSRDVIHPEMGRGHSNYPEARNNVLIRYRSKSISLRRLAYCTWTDIGLLQGNMTWCYRTYGPAYHWIREVYHAMQLPVPEGVVERATKRNEDRMKHLETIKTNKAKERRIALKVARALEQEERRRWNKNRPLQHSYGEEEAVADDNSDSDNEVDGDEDEDREAEEILAQTAMPAEDRDKVTVISVSRKKCICGGSDHMRRSSKKCPLYQKPNKQKKGCASRKKKQ